MVMEKQFCRLFIVIQQRTGARSLPSQRKSDVVLCGYTVVAENIISW